MNKEKKVFWLFYILLTLAFAISVANFFFLTPSLAGLNLIIFAGFVFIFLKAAKNLSRLKTEASLKATELKTVIENIKDGALIYDQNFIISAMNKASEEIFALPSEEVISKKIEPALMKNPRLKILTQVVFPSLAPTASQISQDGWPQIVDISTDDPPRQFRTTLNRLLDEDGKTLGFLKLIQDLTREKGIAQSKEEFITIASHQLRTPLTAINWSFEHLLKNLDDKKPELKEIVS